MLIHNKLIKNISIAVIVLIIFIISVGWVIHGEVRIFLIGDSTMADKPLVDNPERGWGQVFPLFFNERVKIFNHAKNGRSTKSFISENRWQAVYDQLKAGDYVFIQFGHNDAKKEDTNRYAPPRPDYRDNIVRFVRESRAKKAIPILLTPVTRRDFKDGKYAGTHGEYPDIMKEVAKEENVPLIDIFEKSKNLLIKLGDEKSKELYLAGVKPNDFRLWNGKRDNTHFTRYGAIQIASLVAKGIKELKLPLQNYLINIDAKNLVGTGKVVCLDYFFNNEWRIKKDSKDSTLERWHYTWEDTTNGGFSQLGQVIDHLGAELDTLQCSPTVSNLRRYSIYIIVDPDTPKETANPNYISDEASKAIVSWVESGGVLVLMANDKGNAEFEHFNKLAERFGIHFNEDSHHKVVNNVYEMGKTDKFPKHSIFKGVKQIFTKEVSTLKLQKPAEPILAENDIVLMASVKFGKGLVFAVGDPWLYNEYIDHRRLPIEYENYKAAKNLFHWLLNGAKSVK